MNKKKRIVSTANWFKMDTVTILSGSLTTPRLQFFFRQRGQPDGVPMLLLHGSYATSRWWEPFMRILPEEILAVAPDLRGVGGTERASTGYEIEEQAEDVATFVDKLGWHEFELVGHSSGGAIAIEFALTYPDQVRTLTLVDSVPLEGVFTPLETYVLLSQMRQDRDLLAQALRSLMPTLDLADNSPENLTYFEQLVTDAEQMDAAAFTAIADALNHWNRFGDGRDLRLPTLLVWGDQDIIVDRDAMTRTLIAIPGANNLEVLRGVGHSPMIEAPEALFERIFDFITEDFAEFDEVRRIATEDTDC
jgi:branched-chain amino acid transport system permease protein